MVKSTVSNSVRGNVFPILWATDHNALSDIFIYLITVLTPYE